MPTPVSPVGTTMTASGGSVDVIRGVITSAGMDSIQAATIDTTGLGDTSKNYVLGTRESGNVTLAINVISQTVTAEYMAMPKSGQSSTNATTFILSMGTVVGSPKFTFNAYIVKVSIGAEVDKQVTATYTLRITGAITIAVTT